VSLPTPAHAPGRDVVDLTTSRRRLHGQSGAIDVGIETLFGGVAMIALVLLLVETVSFWHARNVFDEAAAEGARVAAAFDGTCAAGTATAEGMIARRASGWSSNVSVSCTESDGIVTVTVSGSTPGVLFDAAGFTASTTESAPKER
jgi:phage-related baseplate assembly protein